VKDSLVKGLKQVVAEETKVGAEGVAIELSKGSLAVRAVIQPGDRSASDVRVALAGSESFGESLTRCFHELRGIDSVSTGTIRIRPAGAPTIVKAPPPASAASWTDGDLAPGLPKRAVWAGCAGACAAVLVTAMVCAVLKLRSEDTMRLPVSMQDEPRDAGKSPLLDSRRSPLQTRDPAMKTGIYDVLTRKPNATATVPNGATGARRPTGGAAGSRQRSQSPQFQTKAPPRGNSWSSRQSAS
jgi:hypothetical protein